MSRARSATVLAALLVLGARAGVRAEDPAPMDATDVVNDTTWSGEVRLARRIEVRPEATLRIEAGTRVTIPWVETGGSEPADKPAIEVFGRLIADGGGRAPIRFEPEAPPKAAQALAWTRWRGIVVHDAGPASARLVRCLIAGAETGFQPGSPESVARDCAFFECRTGVGVGVLWGSADQVIRMLGDVAPTIEGCRFGSCDVGVSVELAARPYVSRCVFVDCRAGIANQRVGKSYPVTGLGAFIDRCEFLRCTLAIGGPSRVTNSVFEANRLVFAGSGFSEVALTSIDPFVRGRNLYWANEAVVRSDVPVGADALFTDPKRRGVTPPKLTADDLLGALGDALGLAADSPGRGAAGDGGDLGAFGGDGTVRAEPPPASTGPGLAVEGWLHLGPGTPDVAALPALAADASIRVRLAGDVEGGAQWAALDGASLADPDGSRRLLAELPAARTLLATLASAEDGDVALGFAWDGTLTGWWNGEVLAFPAGPRRFRPADARITVVRRKGPNTLVLRHVPRMTTGRLHVRVLDSRRDVAPTGLSPAPTSSPGKATRAQPIVGATSSVPRGPGGKPSGPGVLKITVANGVHWRDAINLRRYGLVDPGGKPFDLAGAEVRFQPKDRAVVLTLARPLPSGAWRLRATDWRRATGEPFTPNPSEVTFRVP